MENHLQAHILDMIAYIKYGNKDSNPYEFDGLDKMISTWRTANFGGTKPTDLSVLDYMIDKSNRKGGARHRRVFMMSPEMLSRFSQLLTNVRLNQGLSGSMSQVDINGGWRLNAYRDIPIVETTSNSAIETMRPTVALSSGGTTTGSLSNGNYYVRVAPITYEGEQVAGAEVNITLSGGTSTQWIKITLSDIHKDAAGAINVFSYKIYVSQTTGTETLLKIVPAYTYDSEGSPIGYNGITAAEIPLKTLTPAADVPANMQADVPFEVVSTVYDECIHLWDLDPIQGLGKLPFTNVAGDQFNGLVTTKPLAEVDDYIQFLVKTYAALTPAFEATSVLVRKIRKA
jgi:hypothetical protein